MGGQATSERPPRGSGPQRRRSATAHGRASDAHHRGRSVRRRIRRRRRLRIAGLALAGVVLLGAYGAVQITLAARAGQDGRRHLELAGQRLGDRDLDAARAAFADAEVAFERSHGHLRALGPLGGAARATPFVRVQLRALDDYAEVASLLVVAGQRLLDAAAGVLDPPDARLTVADAVDALREVHTAVAEGRHTLDTAAERIEGLSAVRLLGPLAGLRDEFVRQVPEVRAQAKAADDGLAALIAFAGGDGPRRYLLVSQNPDEPRPTGGFIGSYGVLTTDGAHLGLERYEGIESWRPPLGEPRVPTELAATPLRVPTRPVGQRLRNANATADFPDAADLAMRLWVDGGEEPVDGVVAFTPELLARLLDVLGPVDVPGYGERIDAGNLLERLDFHTHREEVERDTDRKAFLAALAEVTLDALLEAPAPRWAALITAVGDAFEAREAMAWSTDRLVNRVLAERGWDGTVPAVVGDLVHLTEFAYVTKSGRDWQRTIDHRVALRPDGSARITTTVTVTNPLPHSDTGRVNRGTLSVVTVFGPEGAAPVPGAGDDALEVVATASGHPGVSLLRNAEPLESVTFTVAWDAPRVVLERVDGRFEYRLAWLHLPGRDGDELRLRVEPPAGWRWEDDPPPEVLHRAGGDLYGSWVLVGG